MTRRWYLGQSLFLAGSAILLLSVFSHTDLDLRLARPFYDPALAAFPLRQHWFFAPVFYYGLKFAMLAGAMLAGATCLYGLGGRLPWLARRNALLALLGLILIPAAVAGLRLNTSRHCPWDIAEFGGYAPYLDLFAQMPADIVRGMCFPASHAATGFMWLACGLALHDHSPRLAHRVILGTVVLGLLMGLTRQAQGGHFLSHTLWSAWLAWAISVALAAALGIGRSGVTGRPQHASPDYCGVYQTK
jgi:membrane-associated PAP2 superfamily phosphatase